MITKNFTVTIPNEPYTTDTSEGKTVECTYKGPRYVVISTRNGVVNSAEGYFDRVEDYDPTQFTDDQDVYHLIDADLHPLEISFLTQLYTNENIDNYEETLPTGEVYDYDYPDNTGILDTVFNRWSGWTYNPETDTFSDLEFETPISKDFWDNAVQMKIDMINNLDMSTFDDQLVADLNEYKAFFENIGTTYAGVSYWKIPFPNAPVWDE